MELNLRHYGGNAYQVSSIIELTVKSDNATICEDITDLHGKVDEKLIRDLRDIADELEAQNDLVKEKALKK